MVDFLRRALSNLKFWALPAAALALVAGLAFAQTSPGTPTNHSVLISPGPGVVGNRGAAPAASGTVLCSQGLGADPVFSTCAGAGGNPGTVTTITGGAGLTLTPNPIIDSGTIELTVPVTVPHGGTGATSITDHAVVVGQGSAAVSSTGPCAAGQVIGYPGGAAFDPSCMTVSGGGGGSGTVTSIAAGNGITLTPDPIVDTGTVALSEAAGLSVLGRSANSTGDVAPIEATPGANSVFRVNQTGTTLSFGPINLASSSAVTGVAAIANGGSGKSTLTDHGLIIGQGTSAVSSTGPCLAGQIIWYASGASDPSCVSPSTMQLLTAVSSTTPNAGQRLYWAGSYWAPIDDPYIVAMSVAGGSPLTASFVLGYHKFPQAVQFPVNFGPVGGGAQSQCGSTTNAAAITTFNIDKAAAASPNTWSTVATATVSNGTARCTAFNTSGVAVTYAQGDVLRIVGPASPDSALTDPYFSLAGTR